MENQPSDCHIVDPCTPCCLVAGLCQEPFGGQDPIAILIMYENVTCSITARLNGHVVMEIDIDGPGNAHKGPEQ